jgi:hypothetical protein
VNPEEKLHPFLISSSNKLSGPLKLAGYFAVTWFSARSSRAEF